MFRLSSETLKQLRTVYKVEGPSDIKLAASFLLIEVDEHIFMFLDVIRTKTEFPRQRRGSTFLKDLVEFIEQ